MSLIVCIKQVPDTETKIYIHSEASKIEEENIQWILNPYDEYALEEALLFKEKIMGKSRLKEGQGAPFDQTYQDSLKVHAISLGPKRSKEVLIRALAQGADLATHIQTDLKLDSFTVAKALACAIELECESIDMVFTGRLSIDENQSAVPQMVAEFLNIPHVMSVSKVDLLEDGKLSLKKDKDSSAQEGFSSESQKKGSRRIRVERDIEQGGREVLEIYGAALLGANKGLNQPRSLRIPDLIRAKRKPLKVISFESLGDIEGRAFRLRPTLEDVRSNWENFSLPRKRAPVSMIQGDTTEEKVKTLVKRLREEEKII